MKKRYVGILILFLLVLILVSSLVYGPVFSKISKGTSVPTGSSRSTKIEINISTGSVNYDRKRCETKLFWHNKTTDMSYMTGEGLKVYSQEGGVATAYAICLKDTALIPDGVPCTFTFYEEDPLFDETLNVVPGILSRGGVCAVDVALTYLGGIFERENELYFHVAIRGIDFDSGSDIDDFLYVNRPVENIQPIANALCPTIGNVGQRLSFLGNSSTDSDGKIISYSWTFVSGDISSMPNPFYTFTAPETYSVILVVRDNAGGIDTDTCLVTISEAVSTESEPSIGGEERREGGAFCEDNEDCESGICSLVGVGEISRRVCVDDDYWIGVCGVTGGSSARVFISNNIRVASSDYSVLSSTRCSNDKSICFGVDEGGSSVERTCASGFYCSETSSSVGGLGGIRRVRARLSTEVALCTPERGTSEFCEDDYECTSGNCENGRCTEGGVGSDCTEDSDCISRHCGFDTEERTRLICLDPSSWTSDCGDVFSFSCNEQHTACVGNANTEFDGQVFTCDNDYYCGTETFDIPAGVARLNSVARIGDVGRESCLHREDTDGECQEDYECLSNSCTNNRCDEGTGAGLEGCETELDCGNNEICLTGVCVTEECVADSDCGDTNIFRCEREIPRELNAGESRVLSRELNIGNRTIGGTNIDIRTNSGTCDICPAEGCDRCVGNNDCALDENCNLTMSTCVSDGGSGSGGSDDGDAGGSTGVGTTDGGGSGTSGGRRDEGGTDSSGGSTGACSGQTCAPPKECIGEFADYSETDFCCLGACQDTLVSQTGNLYKYAYLCEDNDRDGLEEMIRVVCLEGVINCNRGTAISNDLLTDAGVDAAIEDYGYCNFRDEFGSGQGEDVPGYGIFGFILSVTILGLFYTFRKEFKKRV